MTNGEGEESIGMDLTFVVFLCTIRYPAKRASIFWILIQSFEISFSFFFGHTYIPTYIKADRTGMREME